MQPCSSTRNRGWMKIKGYPLLRGTGGPHLPTWCVTWRTLLFVRCSHSRSCGETPEAFPALRLLTSADLSWGHQWCHQWGPGVYQENTRGSWGDGQGFRAQVLFFLVLTVVLSAYSDVVCSLGVSFELSPLSSELYCLLCSLLMEHVVLSSSVLWNDPRCWALCYSGLLLIWLHLICPLILLCSSK